MLPWEQRNAEPEQQLADSMRAGMSEQDALRKLRADNPDPNLNVIVGGETVERSMPWEQEFAPWMQPNTETAPTTGEGVAPGSDSSLWGDVKSSAASIGQGLFSRILPEERPEREVDPATQQIMDEMGIAGALRIPTQREMHDRLEETVRAADTHPGFIRAAERMAMEEGLYDKAKTFISEVAADEDTFGILTEQAARLAPQMLTMIGGVGLARASLQPFLSGMALNTAGMAGGGFLNSVAVTYGPNVSEALEAGLDFDQAKARAAIQSLAQAPIDAATAAVIPWKIGPNQWTNIPAQTFIQMLGGGTGEAMRNWSIGKEADKDAVVIEGLLEAMGLPGDFVANLMTRNTEGERAETEVPTLGEPGTETVQKPEVDIVDEMLDTSPKEPKPAPDKTLAAEGLLDIPTGNDVQTLATIEANLDRLATLMTEKAKEPTLPPPVGVTQERTELAPEAIKDDASIYRLGGLRLTGGAPTADQVPYGQRQWSEFKPEDIADLLERELASVTAPEQRGRLEAYIDGLRDGSVKPQALLQIATLSNNVDFGIDAISAVNRAFGVDVESYLDGNDKGQVVLAGYPSRKGKSLPGQPDFMLAQEARGRQMKYRLVKDWQQRFMPDVNFVLVETEEWQSADEYFNAEYPYGKMGYTEKGDRPTVYLTATPKVMDEEFLLGWEMSHGGKRPSLAKRNEMVDLHIFETTAHEFGHALSFLEFQHADVETKYAIYQQYNEEVTAELNKQSMDSGRTLSEMVQDQDGIVEWLLSRRNPYSKAPLNKRYTGLDQQAQDRRDYYFSFDEWFARKVSRYATGKESMQGPLRRFYQKLVRKFKQLYARFPKSFRVGTPFEQYMDGLQLSVQRKRLIEQGVKTIETPVKMAAPYRSITQSAMNDLDKAAEGVTLDNGSKLSQPVSGDPLKPPKAKVEGRSTPAESIARMNWLMKWGATLINIDKENPNVPGVRKFLNGVRKLWTDKSEISLMGDTTAKELSRLPETDRENLAKFVHDMTLKSDKEERRLTPKEMDELRAKYPLSEKAEKALEHADRDFQTIIKEVTEVLIADLGRRYKHLPEAEAEAEREKQTRILRAEEKKLLNRNYWPLSRFGQNWVEVEAREAMTVDGRAFKAGDTILFETYESVKEAQKRQKQLAKAYGRRAWVRDGLFPEEVMSFQGMPPQLITRIKAMMQEDANDPDMSAEERAIATERVKKQLSDFDKMLHNMAPGRSYLNRLQRRKGTPGYSLDAIRGYAAYMQTAANHIARIKNYATLLDAMDELRNYRKRIRSGSVRKEIQLEDYLRRHYAYVMNPGEEWANLRALGFLWHLGFNLKSASVNLTQTPLTTWSVMSHEFGDVKGLKHMASASKDLINVWKVGARRPGESYKNSPLDAYTINAIEQGIAEGFLSESLATELAAMAEGSNLQRLLPKTFLGSSEMARNIRIASEWGAYMFQATEKVNRYIAFVAGYRAKKEKELAKRGVKDFDGIKDDGERKALMRETFEFARDVVDRSQFEYARWNRPRLFRGRKSSFMLFKSYQQGMLYFMFRDPAKKRYLAMQLLLAGALGFPFADDLEQILRILAKSTGQSPPEVKKNAREFIKALDGDPDFWLHGASRDLFGMWDLSGSLGMQKIIPGLEPLADIATGVKTSNEALPELVQEIGGALWTLPIGAFQALTSNSPYRWRELEKVMPKALANVSKSVRMKERGYATDYVGDNIPVEFDPMDMWHNIELVGQALGYTITRLNQYREMDWAAKESIKYWSARRQWIMNQLNFAQTHESPQATKAMWDAVTRFNGEVPDPKLKITMPGILRSSKQRWKRRMLKQSGIYPQAQGRAIYEDFKEAWEEASP